MSTVYKHFETSRLSALILQSSPSSPFCSTYVATARIILSRAIRVSASTGSSACVHIAAECVLVISSHCCHAVIARECL
jgi:hypothetical protein